MTARDAATAIALSWAGRAWPVPISALDDCARNVVSVFVLSPELSNEDLRRGAEAQIAHRIQTDPATWWPMPPHLVAEMASIAVTTWRGTNAAR